MPELKIRNGSNGIWVGSCFGGQHRRLPLPATGRLTGGERTWRRERGSAVLWWRRPEAPERPNCRPPSGRTSH